MAAPRCLARSAADPSVFRRVIRSVALAGAAALLPSGLTAQGIPVTVGVGAVQTGAGQFDLPILIDMSARTEKLGSFRLTLRWNPAVLRLDGGADGIFGSVVVNEDSAAAGVLHMSGVNPGGLGGLITLAVGRFSVIGADTTTFRLTVQELYAAGTFANLTASAVPLDRLYCGSLAGTWGDVDKNGSVNGADALIVLTESVGLPVTGYATGLGDVDSSGTRDPRDALIILSYAVGINTQQFRVGQTTSGAICEPPGGQVFGITPPAAEATVAQSVAYFAYGLDPDGAALALRNVTWTSSNPAAATVSAEGVAIAVAPGTATITALQNDTAIATSTLTVLARRSTIWVDALASQARNQLGSPSLPFGTIQEATYDATPGDTLRLRAGRYEGAQIAMSLTLIGDTSAGGRRPTIVPSPDAPAVLAFSTEAVRVELHDLQVDTAAIGIDAVGVDTVLLRHVDVRAGRSGAAAVHVDSAGLVRLVRTRLFGQTVQPGYYYYTRGFTGGAIGTFVADSVLASDFSDDGIYLSQVDSVDVRRSTLRYNQNAGLRILTIDTTRAARLVFSRNRVTQNQYYGVYAQYLRRAALDHNVFVGAAYYGDGMALYGTRSGVLTLRGDTLDIRASTWLYASTWDSVAVDSVMASATDYGADLYDLRRMTITDSRFGAGYYDAIYAAGRGTDTTLVVVRNSEFGGLSNQGYYDGYGLDVYRLSLDVRNSTFRTLYQGVYGYNARVQVAQSEFTDAYYAIDVDCAEGPSRVDSTRIENSYYGIYAYGCGVEGSSLVVDSVDVVGGTYVGVDAGGFDRVHVRQSRFTGAQYAVETYGNDTVRVDTTAMAPLYEGLYSSNDSLTLVTGNTVTCAENNDTYAIELGGGNRALVQGNTITGPCWTAIYSSARDTSEIRGNTITGTGGYRGVYGWLNTPGGRFDAVGNTITGPFNYGSISTDAADAVPLRIRVDSNTVGGGLEAGILNLRGDTVLVRDNTVSNVRTGCCSVGIDGGIVVPTLAGSRKRLEIRRNRVTGSVRGIVLDRAANDTLAAAVVDSNLIAGNDTAGIRVGTAARVLARFNAIDATGLDGVHVDRSVAGDSTHVRFENNNFTGSGRYGVYNLDLAFVDARSNWWGDPNGPGNFETSGDLYQGNVLVNPYSTVPNAVPTSASPPALVAAASSAVPLPPARATTVRVPTEPRAPDARERPVQPPADVAVLHLQLGADRQGRQEERIRRYRLELERRAARDAARAALRKEGTR